MIYNLLEIRIQNLIRLKFNNPSKLYKDHLEDQVKQKINEHSITFSITKKVFQSFVTKNN